MHVYVDTYTYICTYGTQMGVHKNRSPQTILWRGLGGKMGKLIMQQKRCKTPNRTMVIS